MKSIIALMLVVLAFGVLLTGCTKEKTADTTTAPSSEQTGSQPTPEESTAIDTAIPEDTDVELGELV